MLSKSEMQKISNALHSDVPEVEVQGQVISIRGSQAKKGTGFAREVLVDGIRFQQQKLNKTNRLAQAVLEAEKQGKSLKVTLGIRPQPENFVIIVDDHVTNEEPNFSLRNYLIQKIGFAPSRNQGTVATV